MERTVKEIKRIAEEELCQVNDCDSYDIAFCHNCKRETSNGNPYISICNEGRLSVIEVLASEVIFLIGEIERMRREADFYGK